MLDIGCGSGFLTACFQHMVQHSEPEGPPGKTIGIEHIRPLVDMSRFNISKANPELYCNIEIPDPCDGRDGYEPGAPYDVIHVGAAILREEVVTKVKFTLDLVACGCCLVGS